MDRKKVCIEVWVELDPVPGTMHTAESARETLQTILTNSIGHYNPQVVTM